MRDVFQFLAAILLLAGAACMAGCPHDLSRDVADAAVVVTADGAPPDRQVKDKAAPDKASPDSVKADIARPDKATPRLDKAVTKPDKAVAKPDKAVSKPDKAVAKPDKAMTKPDKAVTKPDKAVTKPDYAVTKPDKAVAQPDKAVPKPDKAMPKPDKAIPKPDLKQPDLYKPDMKVTCIPNTTYACDPATGNIHWQDSCKQKGEVYMECCTPCTAGSTTCSKPKTGGIPGQGGGCCAGVFGCYLDELVGWYRMDETHGTQWPIDSSGKGGTGSMNSTVVVNQVGPMNKAHVYGNTAAYITSAAMAVGDRSMTVQLWIKLINTSGGSRGILQHTQYSNHRGYQFSHAGTKLTLCFNDGAGGKCVRSLAVTAPANKWFHLAAVLDRDAGLITAYLDGSKKTTANLGSLGSVATSANFTLGKTIWAGGFYGALDDLRVYNHARTAAQVAVDAGHLAFRALPGGAYYMGSPPGEHCRPPSGEDRHKVSLSNAFEISTAEVSHLTYTALMKYSPMASSTCGTACAVNKVSWHEAAAFCNALSGARGIKTHCYTCSGSGATVSCGEAASYKGAAAYKCPGYRLPSEAEWEYAYRSGVHTAYYNGHNTYGMCKGKDPLASLVGWFDQNTSGANMPPAMRHPNRWGLYDLPGSVFEWSHDVYQSTLGTKAVTDPMGTVSAAGKRSSRGGSHDQPAHMTRAAFRGSWAPGWRSANLGFRCVRTITPKCPSGMALVKGAFGMLCADKTDTAGKSKAEAVKACMARGVGGRVCTTTDLSRAVTAGAIKPVNSLATTKGPCCCPCGTNAGSPLYFWFPSKGPTCGCWRSDTAKANIRHRCCADAS